MADLYEKVTVMGEGLTLSLIVWRRFHRPMPGLVERIMDENQDLADAGYHLPLGTEFLMPIPTPRGNEVLEPIKLW